MKQAYLLTGSNLGDRKYSLRFAISEIQNFARIIKLSNIYESGSWGYESENLFWNQCLLVETELDASNLLKELKEIEKRAGRFNRSVDYEDRVLDIDILFYENEIIEREDLKVPHPRLHLRAFTLVPLSEIAPGFIHPVFEKTISELLKTCPDKDRPVKI